MPKIEQETPIYEVSEPSSNIPLMPIIMPKLLNQLVYFTQSWK